MKHCSALPSIYLPTIRMEWIPTSYDDELVKETSIATSVIEEHDRHLTELEFEERILHTKLAEALENIKKTKQTIYNAKAYLAPIRRLPDDLLRTIFETVVMVIEPERLLFICRRWHNIATSTPSIWADIVLPPRLLLSKPSLEECQAFARQRLRLSSAAPLRITFQNFSPSFYDSPLSVRPPGTSLVQKYWATLKGENNVNMARCVYMRCERSYSTDKLVCDMPLLKELEVEGKSSLTLYKRSPFFFPSLQVLIARGDHYRNIPESVKGNLIHLEISITSTLDIPEILFNLPLLRELCLYISHISRDPICLIHDNLSRLQMHLPLHEAISIGPSLLPQLKQLALNGGGGLASARGLADCQNLRNLKFAYSAQDYLEILKIIPNLEQFEALMTGSAAERLVKQLLENDDICPKLVFSTNCLSQISLRALMKERLERLESVTSQMSRLRIYDNN